MTRATRRALFVAAAAWGGTALGRACVPASPVGWALAGALAGALAAAAGRRSAAALWWLILAVGFEFAALGVLDARPVGEGAVPATRAQGRLAEIAPTDRGWLLTLRPRNGPDRRIAVARTGLPELDRWDCRVTPGALIAAPLKATGSPSGVLAGLSASTVEFIAPPTVLERVRTAPGRLRQAFRARVVARLATPGDDVGAFLVATVAGDGRLLSDGAWQALRASGLAHVAVVSGFNVALIAVALARCTTPLGGAKHPRRKLATIAAAVALLTLLPADPPVRRAAFALLLADAGRLFQRAAPPAAALAGAATVLLALDPQLSSSLSFALTVVATAAIVVAGETTGWWGRVWVFSAPAFATWPVLVATTGRVSPWTLLANLIGLPAAPVSLAGAWCAVLLPGRWAGPLSVAKWVARAGAAWVLGVSDELALWPGSGALAAPTGWLWPVASLAVLACLLVSRRRHARAVLLVLLICCWAWPLRPSRRAPPSPGVEVFAVGQGQAVLIDGGALPILVDAADDRTPDGTRALLRQLRARRVRRLGVLIISHADRDHSGGALELLAAARPDRLAIPDGALDSPAFRPLVSQAARRGIPLISLAAGDEWTDGPLALRVLSPPRGRAGDGNDHSVVLRVDAGSFSALLPGDAGWQVEQALARQGLLFPTDVLVAGHHGARTCTSDDLLRRLRPVVVAISCGSANLYGHPHPDTLARIERAGAAWLTTARSGPLAIRSQGERRLVVAVDGTPARVLSRRIVDLHHGADPKSRREN